MKQNIENVPYNNKTKEKRWWAWDEYCNRCGKLIHSKNSRMSSKEPEDEKLIKNFNSYYETIDYGDYTFTFKKYKDGD